MSFCALEARSEASLPLGRYLCYVWIFTWRNVISPIHQELRIAVAERGELMRGLRQAKVFNDELAKVSTLRWSREDTDL